VLSLSSFGSGSAAAGVASGAGAGGEDCVPSVTWAGGCAAGVWYKVGAGSLGSFAAVLGMAVGATLLERGPLAGLREAIQFFGPPLRLSVEAWAWAPIAGLILGVIFAFLIGIPLEGEGFALSYPIPVLAVIVLLTAFAGVLAAIYPARKASKLDVLEAVSYE